MARIKLKLPDKFDFSTEIPVRVSDINYGGHLGNDSVLSMIHEARIRFLKTHGFTEVNIAGCGLIMVDAVVVYKSEAFHGETMVIEVAVSEPTKYGCDFVYRISDSETRREVARAKTGIVFFDYDRRKITPMPPEFKSACAPENL